MEPKLTAKEIYQKKKVKLAVFGLFLAWLSALAMVIFQNFNVSATDMINAHFPSGLLAAYVLTLLTLSLCQYQLEGFSQWKRPLTIWMLR